MANPYRDEFIQLFTANITREGSQKLLAWLDTTDFYTAPASTKFHCACTGGLVMHSINVYKTMRERYFEEGENEESYAICGLLHDVCKADIYRKTVRQRKNEVGQYEKFDDYSYDYSDLPVGHGEKSVIRLLRSGLDLEDNEILAIRWHMGPWEVDTTNREQEGMYRQAQQNSPLVALVHNADSFAALTHKPVL